MRSTGKKISNNVQSKCTYKKKHVKESKKKNKHTVNSVSQSETKLTNVSGKREKKLTSAKEKHLQVESKSDPNVSKVDGKLLLDKYSVKPCFVRLEKLVHVSRIFI